MSTKIDYVDFIDFKQVNESVSNHVDDLVINLLPNGRREGNQWCALNPTRNDRTLGSFKINLKTAQWADFATNDRGSDLISLYSYILNISHLEAAKTILSKINGEKMTLNDDQFEIIHPIPPFDLSTFKHNSYGLPTSIYPYLNENNGVHCIIVRYDTAHGKKILPFTYGRFKGIEDWHCKRHPSKNILYNLPELIKNKELNKKVILGEGEKTATALNKISPDYIGITSSFGANSASKTDWGPIAGMEVLIWPDKDDAGNRYAQDVFQLCIKAGAKKVTILELPSELPTSWDPADPIPPGLDLDINMILDNAPFCHFIYDSKHKKNNNASIEVINDNIISNELNDDILYPYSLHDEGLFYSTEKSGKVIETMISSYIRIVATTCDTESKNWGRVLLIRDLLKNKHILPIPVEILAGDSNELLKLLFSRGLIISNDLNKRKHLIDYIIFSKPNNHILSVNKTGWHQIGNDLIFVSPNMSYGNVKVILQLKEPSNFKIKSSGSLEEWQDKIAKFANGNTLMKFAMSCGFASHLLKLCNSESCFIHISGETSKGKTTLEQVIASIFSDNTYIKQWSSTANGLEGIASQYSDYILILDEFSQASSKEISYIVYLLSNNQGKIRANKFGNACETAQWRTLVFSTGEKNLRSKLEECGNSKIAGGLIVRFIELELDPNSQYGIFDNIYDFTNSENFSNYLKEQSNLYYGTADNHFMNHLIQGNEKNITEWIKEKTNNFLHTECPYGSSGYISRVARKFAMIGISGELAIKYGTVPWPTGSAMDDAKKLFKRWHSARDVYKPSELQQGLDQVKSFILTNGDSRFASADEATDNFQKTTINRVGFKKRVGEEYDYYIFQDIFKNEVCKGYNANQILKELKAQDFLGKSEDDRHGVKSKMPGMDGDIRYYHITANFLSGKNDKKI